MSDSFENILAWGNWHAENLHFISRDSARRYRVITQGPMTSAGELPWDCMTWYMLDYLCTPMPKDE